METRHRVSERLYHYRTLLVIIAITALVWMVWAMSDIQTYPTQVRMEMSGIDTARYAIVKADTTLNIEVESDGFSAMRRYFKLKRRNIVVDMSRSDYIKGGRTISVSSFIPSLKEQLGLPSALRVVSSKDSIRVWISERQKKGFVPQLKNVSFDFTDQCGLYGEPIIKPDTVWLYGSEESLSKIGGIYTSETEITGINSDKTVTLELEPNWEKYPDVRISTKKVRLMIPTRAYIEKSFNIPVGVENVDTSITVKVYPEQVKVTFWVPINEYKNLLENEFLANITLRENEDRAQVMIKNFPSSVRVKQIKPEYVQYIIIK